MFSSVVFLGSPSAGRIVVVGLKKKTAWICQGLSYLFWICLIWFAHHTHTNHALQPLKVVWPRQTSDGEAVKVEAMDLGLKFEMYQFEFKVCNCQNVHTGSAFEWPYPP